MKAYDILEFNNEYKYVVLATSYENPVDELDEIEYDLASKKYSGMVLFDLLLCNGMNSNRYIEMTFDGEHFDIFTSKVLKNPSEITEKFINQYLKSKPLLIQNSVLPNAQRYLLQRGI
jgi:hypothetical protein